MSVYAPPATLDDLRRLMEQPETTRVEFKEARNGFRKQDALKYLCAFANEGGGSLILGVSDKQPRQIVGSNAFLDIEKNVHEWSKTLGRRILPLQLGGDLFEETPRVLVLSVEGRLDGEWVRYDKTIWVREGEALVPMSPGRMREIAMEATDVSDQLVPGATLDDLDPVALDTFRDGLVAKAPSDAAKRRYRAAETDVLLRDLGLLGRDGTLTKAALLLVGQEAAIQRWLPQAEVIFEKRKRPTSIRYETRIPIRRPLLLGLDELVDAIMPYARLNPIELVEGTRVSQLPRYPERSVREAILNAVAHRDYGSSESVFVHLSDDLFVVTSPGAFPGDVTPENVADRQVPRNRRLAEALDKCGLIERTGMGVDLMMEAAVRRAQPLPEFEEPDGLRVRVTLAGREDADFLEFTRQIDADVWDDVGVEGLRTLDAMRRRIPTSAMNSPSVQRLIDLGLAQRTTDGHLRPADQWFGSMAATRRRRLTVDGLKDQIVEVLQQNEPAGLGMKEIQARFPDQTREQLRKLLNSMRGSRVDLRGGGGGRRWHTAWNPNHPLSGG